MRPPPDFDSASCGGRPLLVAPFDPPHTHTPQNPNLHAQDYHALRSSSFALWLGELGLGGLREL